MNNSSAIFDADIAEHLATLAERPWPEWKNGKPITPRQIARLLRPFDIKPGGTVREGKETKKGYKVESFDDAFARYLPVSSVIASQANSDAGFQGSLNVTALIAVTDRNVTVLDDVTHQEAWNPAPNKECDAVTYRKAKNGDDDGLVDW